MAAGAAGATSGDGGERVKLLCSLGGRILRRPSDGALRYAGGDTRIVSVVRSSALADIVAKISDAYFSGGAAVPIAIKYQLPDEDLDALISVSTPEDLENMMEEYDKLAKETHRGGPSPKLRVFLFPVADLTGGNDDPDADLQDTGAQYLEAVNGIRRRDSAVSMSSTQNSDAMAAGGGAQEGGMSPGLLSPTSMASNDASRSVFGAPPPLVDASGSGGYVQILNSMNSERPAVAPYVPQPYVEPPNALFATFQSAGLTPNSTKPPISQISSGTIPIETRVNPYSEDNPSEQRTSHPPGEAKYKQPLSQLPPLPPSFFNTQGGEQFGMYPVMPLTQGQNLRLEDCNMCHKGLPHAHSDTLLNDYADGRANAVPLMSPMFHSLRPEDVARMIAPERVISGGIVDRGMESRGEKMVAAAQPIGDYRFSQITPEMPHDKEKVILSYADHPPPSSMVLPTNAQNSYAMFIDPTRPWHEDFSQKLPPNIGARRYPVEQDIANNPFLLDANSTVNPNFHGDGQMFQDNVPAFSVNYVKPVDRMMEALRVSSADTSGPNEQWKPIVSPDVATPQDFKTENAAESNFVVRPEGQNEVHHTNTFFSVVPEGKSDTLIEPSTYTSSTMTQLQNLQPSYVSHMPSMISMNNPYPYHPETGLGVAGVPTSSYGTDLAYSSTTIMKNPIMDWKEAVPQTRPNDIIIPLSGNVQLSSGTATTHSGSMEQLQEPVSSDSVFGNEDPWKVLGNTNVLPPRPKKVASKESISPKDLCSDNSLSNSKLSDVTVPSDESAFHQTPNILNKEPHQELVQGVKGEHFELDLKAMEEGMVASVLQSSETSFAREIKESVALFDEESGTINSNIVREDHITEVLESKLPERTSLGFPIADDIGRLQIIKNSDLEELQELGSGTFGTVYHGKWRGSDVAIKRINERCFAGKPSEQERTRSDFWNEASKLADLHHPNVVAFYGVVLDGPGGSIATVTEYMVNGSLRHALQKNDKTLDRRKRLIIAMDAAFGMEYLHSKNIVHFDLKSDNLLVNLRDPQRPICKVGDLGLSKVKCQTLISGGVRGTLPWMAPELLNGGSSLVSEKVDVFSFGIVMWELLTGDEPYADLHYGVIIGGIVSNTLRPQVPESCDPEWRSLMEQCWSTEPSDRPSFTVIASRLRSMAASPQKGQA
ncbi:uncharacterized protein [Typha angustifolia]|uniref:uncharacterized protein n=1 Tax=Typha angustifolia TaxID=59011 RepID=UPI003C2B1758